MHGYDICNFVYTSPVYRPMRIYTYHRLSASLYCFSSYSRLVFLSYLSLPLLYLSLSLSMTCVIWPTHVHNLAWSPFSFQSLLIPPKRNDVRLKSLSRTVWPDDHIVFSIFGHLQPWKFAQIQQILPKWAKNFAQNQINLNYIANDFEIFA